MKNLFFAVLCFVSTSSFATWETITGNGNIKKETRNLSGYTGISLSGNMNVVVEYGNTNSITVEADENLLPYIETEVKQGDLVIKTREKVGIKSSHKLNVYVSLTKVSSLKVAGSGNINGNGNFTNEGTTMLAVSGSGNINLEMNSFDETNIAISGSGNVMLKGKSTNNINATISGSGNIDASGVSCNDVLAHVSGSGDIKVYANRSIDAHVSGSGNIYYKGAATKLNIKSSGSGKIVKV